MHGEIETEAAQFPFWEYYESNYFVVQVMAATLFLIPKMCEGTTAFRFLIITDRPGANGDNSVSLAPDWPGGNGDNSVPEVDLGDILLAAGVQQTQGRVNATTYI
jgi:hypothetical protein